MLNSFLYYSLLKKKKKKGTMNVIASFYILTVNEHSSLINFTFFYRHTIFLRLQQSSLRIQMQKLVVLNVMNRKMKTFF